MIAGVGYGVGRVVRWCRCVRNGAGSGAVAGGRRVVAGSVVAIAGGRGGGRLGCEPFKLL